MTNPEAHPSGFFISHFENHSAVLEVGTNDLNYTLR